MDPRTAALLGPGWTERIGAEFSAPYFLSLKKFLVQERARGTVYPKGADILNAFHLTPFDSVRVVILGQDPYHGPGQAHGLSFSVPDSVPPPPSLLNMFKELERSLGITPPRTGNLTKWAEQGVLLLNATLTVRAHQVGSHQGKGWETFTDQAIRSLSLNREGLVFLLWGRFAQAKSAHIDAGRHTLLMAPHPSPLSAHRGFIGCDHFKRANEILTAQGGPPIDWSL